MAGLIGVRITPQGYHAYCLRGGEETSLGLFVEAEMAAQAHDCAAIKVALEEGVPLRQVELNEPLTEEWTEDILEGLKVQSWEELLALISADPTADPEPSAQPPAKQAPAEPSVSSGPLATPCLPRSTQVSDMQGRKLFRGPYIPFQGPLCSGTAIMLWSSSLLAPWAILGRHGKCEASCHTHTQGLHGWTGVGWGLLALQC